jgi:pyruvate-formate lyase-activating enzyme
MVDVAVTPIETLEMAQKVAKESGLEWVYLGNV